MTLFEEHFLLHNKKQSLTYEVCIVITLKQVKFYLIKIKAQNKQKKQVHCDKWRKWRINLINTRSKATTYIQGLGVEKSKAWGQKV